MGSHLVYGDIALQNVLTREFSQAPVTDPSGTDIWYWKYQIRVSSIIHMEANATVNRALTQLNDYSSSMGLREVKGESYLTSNEDPATQLLSLREKLLSFRKPFKFIIGNKTILYALPINHEKYKDKKESGYDQGGGSQNELIDVNNGPKPLECRINQISKNTFNIDYGIEVCLACGGTNNPSGILGNRWSCVDDIDESFRTTRTWNGRLRTIGSMSPKSMVHKFRHLCLPPLLKGFRRKAMKFAGEPTGTELEYTVTDEQITGDAPPKPAANFRGTHTESVGMTAQGGITGNVQIYIEGIPGAPKNELIALGMRIANHKLGVKEGEGNSHTVQSLRVTDYMGPNSNGVEVQIQVLHNPGNVKEKDVNTWGATIIGRVGEPLSELFGKDYGPYLPNTSAGVGLANAMYCYLQTPCDYEHRLEAHVNQEEAGTEEFDKTTPATTKKEEAPKAIYEESQALGPWKGKSSALSNSEAGKACPWQYSQVDMIDVNAGGRIAMPMSQPFGVSSLAVIQIAAPTSIRTMRIAAERLGDFPLLPSSESITIDGKILVYLNHKTNIRQPKLSGDGVNWIYAVDAEYTYALPSPWESQIPIGNGPDVKPNDKMKKKFSAFTPAVTWMK